MSLGFVRFNFVERLAQEGKEMDALSLSIPDNPTLDVKTDESLESLKLGYETDAYPFV